MFEAETLLQIFEVFLFLENMYFLSQLTEAIITQ